MTIADVAPAIALRGDPSEDEGSEYEITLGAVTALDRGVVRARADAALAFGPENTEVIAYLEARLSRRPYRPCCQSDNVSPIPGVRAHARNPLMATIHGRA